QPGPEAEGLGVLYANMSGTTVARSVDGGRSWEFVVGKAQIQANYPCVLHVPTGDPGQLYQGCEAPLDVAWVARRDITSRTGPLPAQVTLVHHDEIENRRPNSLTSGPGRPGRVYVGLEGGLIWLEGDAWDWVYQKEAGPPTFGLYTYVRAIWIDPCDPDHLVFGGTINGVNPRLNLYETFDHGPDVQFVDPPFSLGADPRIETGAAAGPDGRDFVLLITHEVDRRKQVRVLLRRYAR
ncbi:MAG: hypothetical protein WBV82_05560, partial [Myxococcaceae bacterium]